MKKRWITAALTLSLCVSTQGITYAASTTKTATGTQEISYAKKNENQNIVTQKLENKKQSWTYNKKTHTLTIKGTGKLNVPYYAKIPKGCDWDWGEAEILAPWHNYAEDITSVVIGDGITAVSATRFDELPNLQNITLGKGITSINKEAFNFSYNLKAISLSEKNTSFSFENGALMDKAHTTVYLALGDENHTVTIPSTVTYINPKGLEHAELKQITVDENNPNYTSVDGVLYSKDLKTLYRIPAAYNNTLNLPSQLQELYGFDITDIFRGKAKNLSQIVFGEGTAASIFISFLRWNRHEESPVYLDVTKNHAFSVVDGAVYDKGMTTLYVYQGTGQEYVMPDTIVDLYGLSTVFPNTCNLTSITLGANFQSDSDQLHTANLQSIQVSTQNAIYSSVDGMLYSKDQTACILCPESYGKNITIPEGVKEIRNEAFKNMTVETISLPSTLELVYSNAFSALRGLKTIEIPVHAKVCRESINDCTDLETIIWNSQEASLNIQPSNNFLDTHFINCPNLTNLIIGPDANNISPHNLQLQNPKTSNTKYFSNITLDEKNPNYILKDKFLLDKTGKTLYAYLTDNNGTLKLPKGVTTIGPEAFAFSRNLKQVILPDSLETIGTKAFFKCQTLQTLTFPKKVSKIGEKSFYRCNGLKKVTFKGNKLKSCAKDAFQKNGRSFTVYGKASSLPKLKKVLKKCKISDTRYISRFKTFS